MTRHLVGNERRANWCEGDGVRTWRKSMGQRWCFRHRARHEFFRVARVPDGLSYYGPSVSIEGPTRECTDLFPGWMREWGDD